MTVHDNLPSSDSSCLVPAITRPTHALSKAKVSKCFWSSPVECSPVLQLWRLHLLESGSVLVTHQSPTNERYTHTKEMDAWEFRTQSISHYYQWTNGSFDHKGTEIVNTYSMFRTQSRINMNTVREAMVNQDLRKSKNLKTTTYDYDYCKRSYGPSCKSRCLSMFGYTLWWSKEKR